MRAYRAPSSMPKIRFCSSACMQRGGRWAFGVGRWAPGLGHWEGTARIPMPKAWARRAGTPQRRLCPGLSARVDCRHVLVARTFDLEDDRRLLRIAVLIDRDVTGDAGEV